MLQTVSNHFKSILWIMLLLISAGHAESAGIRFDSLRVESQTVVGNVRIHELMDKEIMRGLRKGMTAVIEYRVQVWQEKSRFIKSLVHEQFRRIKINFDHWERKYQVQLKEDRIRLFDETELMEYCQHLHAFQMIRTDKLEYGCRYRIVVQASVKPMSVENMKELKQWLSGEADDFDPKDIRISKSPWKKTGDWVLNVFINLMGLGDHVLTGTSSGFYVADGYLLRDEGS